MLRLSIKRLLKIAGLTFGSLLALFSVYLALLIYPGVLFAHSETYGNLTIHSDDDLTGIDRILREIDQALMTSEINDPDVEHDIFLGNGNRIFRWTQKYSSSPSYNISLPPYISQVVTFYRPIIESESLVHPVRGAALVNQSLVRTLAHEVVHTLIRAELGLRGVIRTPLWKQEGYADYVAASASILADSDYRLRDSVDRILSQELSWLFDEQGSFVSFGYDCLRHGVVTDEEGRWWNTCYYLSRVMVEYVLDVEAESFQTLMSPEVTDTAIWSRLIAAYEADRLD